MTHAEIAFAVVVGVSTAIGVIVAGVLASRASDRAARSSREALEHQTKLNAKTKIAEFRQEWINGLRNEMMKFMGMVYDPKHGTGREVMEVVTKIQLLMNPKDERYPALKEGMNDFVTATLEGDKLDHSDEFVTLCQDILKTEWEVLKRELLELRTNSIEVQQDSRVP